MAVNRFLLILLILCFITRFSKGQNNVFSFETKCRQISINVFNDSEQIFKMPNGMRVYKLLPDIISVSSDTLSIFIEHENGSPVNFNEENGNRIVKEGILAYEEVPIQTENKYKFKVPNGILKLNKISWIKLVFDDGRKFMIPRRK